MKRQLSQNRFIIEQLESRLLLSADAALLPLDNSFIHEQDKADLPVIELPLIPDSSDSSRLNVEEQKRSEIIFIDAGVPDYQHFVNDLSSRPDSGKQIEVVILESNRDGVLQISEALARYEGIDAVHIVSHGTDGAVQLGSTWLTLDTLDAYADSIEGWKDALTGKADLLLYGCDLAAGEDGRALINNLTLLIDADVAASNDLTGNALMGGDWNLEFRTGDIETRVALSAEVQESWTGLLAVVATDDFSSGYSGGSGWTGNWTEINDDASSVGGRVKISGATLQLENAYDSSGNPANYKGIYRQVDLSSASGAILTFDYKRFTPQTGGQVLAEVGYGGSNWRTLATYDLTAADGIPVSSGNLTINASETAIDTQIRFRTTGTDTNAYIQIDNIQISTSVGTTTIDDGTAPADKTVGKNQTNNAVSAFSLSTDSGTDTLTDLTVTFSGTNVSDVIVNGVKIWQDNGTVANEWDPSDNPISTASFSGTTASFTGLSVNVTTSATQYLVTYDADAGVTEGNTLQGAITAATVSNTLVNNDDADATLTYDIDWYNANWDYRKEITFDPSMTPNSDQYYFSVLVKLASDANLAASATANSQPNGDDILFTLSDGTTKLDHEIETFVSATGELWAWVEIPILSSSVDTTIYMYYGNGAAGNQQNVAGTWDEDGSNNYVAVWHLDEDQAGTGIAGVYKDSSGNNFHGDDQVSATAQNGQVNGGQDFDGADDYIQIADDNALDLTGGEFTISAWVYARSFGELVNGRIIDHGGGSTGSGGWSLLPYDDAGEKTYAFYVRNGTTSQYPLANNDAVILNQWQHVTVTMSGGTVQFYIDGQPDGSTSSLSNPTDRAGVVRIGQRSEDNFRQFDGFIDEVNIASTARSADWIKTSFNNESTPGVYTSISAQQIDMTTIGDGNVPVDKNVWGGGYHFTASTFTLSTDSGSDTVSSLTVAFSGTDVNDVRSTGVGGVAIWRDDGLTPDQWDKNDTQIGSTVSFSGATATVNGLSEAINGTATQYLITYNIDPAATPTNTLQASITAATVGNTLTDNDNTDATLTVQADYVHETSVYKFVYAPGLGEELYLKNSDSPTTNILQGMSIGSLYSGGPQSLLSAYDPDATVTTIVNNSAVEQVQMSGELMSRTGDSYGAATTIISFYADRVVFDMNVSVTSNPSGADWLFMSYGTFSGAMDTNLLYSGNSNPFSNQTTNYSPNNQTEPLSYQTLFELGATDGLVNATLQHDGSFALGGNKFIDNGGSFDVAFQKDISAAPIGNFNSSVMYSFGTTTSGLDPTLAEERRDGFFVSATLDFTIPGNDGINIGYVPERGAYTLQDDDDPGEQDHVKFEFQPSTTHHSPVFEIGNWSTAAPDIITVGGVTKVLGTDYNAELSGTTLYLQYLGDIAVNTTIEIGNDFVSGTVYSDEGTTNIGAGKTVRLLVNGASVGTATTDVNGRYSIFTNLAGNDTLLVYVDGDDGSTDDGTTVTVTDGEGLAGLDIYTDHLITRHDNAGVMTNTLLDAADGAGGDAEILYSVAGGNLTVSGANTELYVPGSHTFTSGGDVSTHDIKIIGTVTAGDNAFTVSGNWNSASGTFTYDTSTVIFNAVATGNTITLGSAEFYDIDFNSATGDWTLLDAITANNNFTITDTDTAGNGVDFNDQAVNVAGDFTVIAGNLTAGTSTITVGGNWDSSGGENMWSFYLSTVNLTGTGTIRQRIAGGAWQYGLGHIILAAAGETTTVTSSELWTSDGLTVGSGTFTDGAGSSTVYIQGVGDVFVDGGATITIQNLYYRSNSSRGPMNVVGRDYTGIVTLGFYGVGGAPGDNINNMQGNIIANNIRIWENNSTGNLNVLNTNDFNITANSLTIGLNGDPTEYGYINCGSSNIDINGNVIIYASDGSGTNGINAGSSNWTVFGNWTNNDTFTPGTSTVTFDGGNQSINGSTTFYNFTKVDSTNNATDITLTFDNTAIQTINGMLTLDGLDADDRINLVSDNAGNQWGINLIASATKGTMDYLDVTDSDASGSEISHLTIDPANSVDGGNNLGWWNHLPVGIPTISGTVTEDQVLTANTAGISDADGLGAFSYQWLRNGVDIVGATAGTYTLGDADVGTQISVEVSYTDGHGTVETVTSAQTAAVGNINDAPVGLTTISGTVTEDQVLTANTAGISDADGLGAFSYQWLRNGVAIGGATASTYTLGDADVGTQISVEVSYTDGQGTNETVTSVQTAAVTNINDAPVGLPTISGTVTEDQILTANTAGISDDDGLGAFSYQWLRNGVAIGGATASTYTLGDADVGTQISVEVSYTDGQGTNETVTSVQTAAVANINDNPIGLPTISGTVTEDQILTANTAGISDDDGLGAFSYQWLRNGVAIGGATASTYTLGDADVGTQISVEVSYTDGQGTNETVTSVQTAAVANINDNPIGLPTISGTVTEDQILTANTAGISDDDGLGAFSYQWLRNGVAIGGATASTYTLGDADVGTQISVEVSYTDGQGTNETVTSVQTAAVANINDNPIGLPTISGTVTEDQILTANTAGISDDDGLGAFSYQWLRNGVAIGGATASTYTLGDADVGTQISVEVSYTDGQGTNETVTSVQTAAVANINDNPIGLPTISGTVTEDQILTANTAGISDDDGLGAFSYQWLRNGVAIGGATASTYTLGDADVGTQISVEVSYTDGQGTNETVTSVQTAAVANINDNPIGLPTISGTVTEDQILTANTAGISDDDGLGAFSYQWLRNGVAIGGATASTYTLGDADVGTQISVEVSYTDGHGTNETVTSVQTAAVANINDNPIGLPTISGTVTEDQILTANTAGISDDDGLGAFSYQWLRNGVAIGGATASTYTLGDADVGTQISVEVSYTDGQGTNETVTSVQTAAVANINDNPIGLPTISGTVTEDQILTANTAGISDDDGLGAFSYQWLRNGVAIGGATASTYTLGDADVGTQISVEVSYTDGYGTVETVTSVQTAAVININDAPNETILNTSYTEEEPEIDIKSEPESNEEVVNEPEIEEVTILIEDNVQVEKTLQANSPLATSVKKRSSSPDNSFESRTPLVTGSSQKYDVDGSDALNTYSTAAYTPSVVINYVIDKISNVFTDLTTSIENLRSDTEAVIHEEEIITKTVLGGTVTLSVGLATWVMRSGSLLASALTTMPIWKGFDPLHVLPLSGKETRQKIRQLRKIEEEENEKNKKMSELLDASNEQQQQKNVRTEKS